ncbi:antiterminator LoaP [Paenibacillus kyungheensis]|uniref:Transcription termination/antitermination protein NusG n=1 Tax=Paenibacillus kyungheensis TaxID=1452732 RepID=A0AAX3M9H3_9BACL|nr:antiterminator LoaP [Paenibacillus kyungheensis]WCT58018.1 antiterminator LoaP [Paenibacillus kyungheensis]
MKWYVLFVKNGEEDYVKNQIQMRLNEFGCNCLVPKRKVPEKKNGIINHVVKIMFPGYVFLQTKMNFFKYDLIKTIPHIIYFLNYRNKKDSSLNSSGQHEEAFFKFIPDNEMNGLLNLINLENDTLEYSKFCLDQEKLTIISGPLIGMEGRIKKIDRRKQRAKLLINVMGQEKLVDIGFEVLNLKNYALLDKQANLREGLRKKVERVIRTLIQIPEFLPKGNTLANYGMNSITFLRLMCNLETEFGIELCDDDLCIERLKTVDDITYYIQKKI